MAMTTPRSKSPTEPFPPLDPGLRTPPSLPPIAPITSLNQTALSDQKRLLSPHPRELPEPTSRLALSPKIGSLPRSPRISPVQLTGQAAVADAKRRQQHLERATDKTRQMSPNPAVEAMQSLMGGQGMSRPSDAPAPGKLSEPLRKAAEKINMSQITDQPQSSNLQVSPTSVTSFGSMESSLANNAMTSTAPSSNASAPQFMAEPTSITDDARPQASNGASRTAREDDNKAFSYPGPPPASQTPDEGHAGRGMSFPGFGQDSPKSPPTSTSKRHKCPYCSTEFTRHHNLKSHLLTHSQEKPYECNACHARFRRLHDLKRHSKLHTGERPHTCDKCGRRFARGDALARHNKGPGGCAGRRGSFNGEDDYGPEGAGGEGMDGVEYTGGNDDEESEEHAARRVSEPSRKRQHVDSGDENGHQAYRQHSSTYPPAPSRTHAASMSDNHSNANNSSMAPPQVVRPGNHGPSPGSREALNLPHPTPYYNSNGQVFEQRSMIESPKPLSPGQPADGHRLSVSGDVSMSSNRHRSPSLTTQFQQQHFGRGSGGRTPPQPSMHFPSSAPVLPPLHHTNQHPARMSLGGGSSAVQSQSRSISSHPSSSGGLPGVNDAAAAASAISEIGAALRSLEQRFSRMQDEYELRISRLQEEVISLKGQISAATASQYSSGATNDSMSGVTRY